MVEKKSLRTLIFENSVLLYENRRKGKKSLNICDKSVVMRTGQEIETCKK